MTTPPHKSPSPPIFTLDDAERIRAVFPSEMLAIPQWVPYSMVWKVDLAKFDKIPMNPNTGANAKSNDPRTWGSYDLAVKRALNRKMGGVGFVFSKSDPYVGIDLDKCVSEDGVLESWAQEIIDELNSYTEKSPSGKGYHILGRGVLPPRGRRKGQIEIYETGRFFTVTGIVAGPGTLRDFQIELDVFHTRLFDRQNRKIGDPLRDFDQIVSPVLSDAEVIEKASQAENGAKFDALWRGAWQNLEYPSQSEADQALCNKIAWYVRFDPLRVDALFRQSGLFRPEKWDKSHYADGRTYGQVTIDKSVTGHGPHEGYKATDRTKRREPQIVPGGRLEIAVNRQLVNVLADAWRVVHSVNSDPGGPHVFQRSGLLARIRQNDDSPIHIAPMSKEAIMTFLFERADWVVWGEKSMKPAKPPPDVVAALLCNPDAKLPRLSAVSSVPFLGAEGGLIIADGYHQRDYVWLHKDDNLKGLTIPDHPSPSVVRAAVEFITGELLIDFPFPDQSDRAHALAALLLPFVRPRILGATPLHLIEAPTPGSGKTLLANLIGLVSTGEDLPAQTLPHEEEETRKRLTSILRRAPSIVLLDNVTQKARIESGALCSVLTTSEWEDRLLGVNEEISLKNRAIWLMTANNPRMSLEIASRTIRIRIDPRVEEPWEREGFRHADIRTWTKEHRRELVEALLTMVTAWIAAGCPFDGKRLGRFEQWTFVIGGILQNAGVDGFLANRKELYKQVDEESLVWRELVEQWWEVFKDTPVQAGQLNNLCEERDLMVRLRGEGSQRSQATRLGTALRRIRDSIKAGHRIHVDVTLKNASGNFRNNGYRLTKAEDQIGDTIQSELQVITEDSPSLDLSTLDDEAPF